MQSREETAGLIRFGERGRGGAASGEIRRAYRERNRNRKGR